jgi:hypothetical protein
VKHLKPEAKVKDEEIDSEEEDPEKKKEKPEEKLIEPSNLNRIYACVVLASIYTFLTFAKHPFN